MKKYKVISLYNQGKSIREIMRELGYKSPSPVQWHIKKYEQALKTIEKYVSGLTTLGYDSLDVFETKDGIYLLKSEVIEMMKKLLLTGDNPERMV